MNICVFCSSSNAISQKYADEAVILGKILAKNKLNLVFGGANVGLMKSLADSVNSFNGNIIGVIPTIFKEKNLQYSQLKIRIKLIYKILDNKL